MKNKISLQRGDFVYNKERPNEVYLVLIEVVTLVEESQDYFVLEDVLTKNKNVYSYSQSNFVKVIDENKLRVLNLLYKL